MKVRLHRTSRLYFTSVIVITLYKLFYSGSGNDTVLKQTLTPIVDREECNRTEDLVGLITPYMICSGWEEGKNDACQVYYVLFPFLKSL